MINDNMKILSFDVGIKNLGSSSIANSASARVYFAQDDQSV